MYFCTNLGGLRTEIRDLSKNLIPKIQKSLENNANPVKENAKEINNLVFLQQKHLNLSATKYGLHHKKTLNLANNYLCSLVFRICIINFLLKIPKNKILEYNSIIFKRTNFCR